MDTRHLRLKIVFDHTDFVIFNKPVGMAMHDAERGIIPAAQAFTGERELYLCHRLDTVTSGCLLLAKNKAAAASLSELFALRRIQKYYLAALSAKPSRKQGTIAGDMKNRRRGQHVLTKTRENPAVTQFFSYNIEGLGRIAIVKPLTGKTHQIRVAMKSLGAPILGDSHYGAPAHDRVSLHAWQLHFSYRDETIFASCLPDTGAFFKAALFSNWLAQQPDITFLPWPAFTVPEHRDNE